MWPGYTLRLVATMNGLCVGPCVCACVYDRDIAWGDTVILIENDSNDNKITDPKGMTVNGSHE